MGLLDKIFGKKRHSEIFTDDELLNGRVYPNCWGIQEYDSVIR